MIFLLLETVLLTASGYQYGKLVGGDVAETGTGPGSYDIRKSVWHVNCCSPSFNGGGGWSIFNASMFETSGPFLDQQFVR